MSKVVVGVPNYFNNLRSKVTFPLFIVSVKKYITN